MPRLLVIDDHEDLRELMGVILRRAGYDVELAGDGEEGLLSQRERPADLVITDVFMPNQDGIETVAQLRREYPRLKLVVVSGGFKDIKPGGYFTVAQEIGVHAVLAKPFEADDLLRAVSEALR